MDIFRGFKFFQVILVIVVSLVSLTTLPLKGYCDDDWVFVYSNKDFTMYYNPSSVEIYKENKKIKVLEKKVFTEKGKIDYFPKYSDLNHTITLNILDYKEWNFSIIHFTYYSKEWNVLLDADRQREFREWVGIKHGSVYDILLNNIIKKYNIKR
jgi:hypothetical protein